METYRNCVDYIIRGESEITFGEFAKAIEKKQDVSQVSGISFLQAGKYIKTPDRKPLENLDVLPYANRSIASEALNQHKNIEIGILTQRGCPFPCSFCNANRFLSNESKMAVRMRTPKNIASEMEELSPLLHKNKSYLRFYDATFVTQSKTNRKWIKELCDEIEKKSIKVSFDTFIRANSFNFSKKDDLQLLDRLKKCGMVSTYIGLESGSEQTLEIYNKKVGVNESEMAFNYLKSINIHGSTNGCMTFQQQSSINDVVETVKFLYRIGLCSFWNCLSRAETLPGIKLEMNTSARKTCWDIYNYNFFSSHVEKLYTIMSNINRSYRSIKAEDKIIRYLRDRIRIEIFYNEFQIDFYDIQNNLEKEIKNLQKTNRDFILYLCGHIKDINVDKVSELISNYLDKHSKKLANIYQKYKWVLELQSKEKAIAETDYAASIY